MSDKKTARIAELIDAFRTSGVGGTILLTRGVGHLDPDEQKEIVVTVKAFKEFTPGNDPYGHHDFGAFAVGEHKLFWKIDYYAHDMMHGSNDASDPDKTKRVLTIMFRDEY
jgi:hypothetical protein